MRSRWGDESRWLIEDTQVVGIELEDELARSYGRYAHAIILDRAIPDVRDGLKPVQRRIVYAMFEAGNGADKPYRKSAKTVGEVMLGIITHTGTSLFTTHWSVWLSPGRCGGLLLMVTGNFGGPMTIPPLRCVTRAGTELAAALTQGYQTPYGRLET